jgi:molecular chaperone DnaK
MHTEEGYHFPDKIKHAELVKIGTEALKADDFDKLRQVVAELAGSRMGASADDDMMMTANIVRG